MGHASVTNLSDRLIKQLYAKGQISIQEVADDCIKRGETLHASEGRYEERYMICLGLEDCVRWLLLPQKPTPKSKAVPVIEVCEMTEEQTKVYNEWIGDGGDDWDSGDDGMGGEYGMLDSIKWKFAPGWRKRYPEIESLDRVSH